MNGSVTIEMANCGVCKYVRYDTEYERMIKYRKTFFFFSFIYKENKNDDWNVILMNNTFTYEKHVKWILGPILMKKK